MQHANYSQGEEKIVIAGNIHPIRLDQKSQNLNFKNEEEDDIFIEDSVDYKCK
tara:strand:+ start:1360 stop:1518 length:159 start_codon:yes stop_codon:yes gene_type:complete